MAETRFQLLINAVDRSSHILGRINQRVAKLTESVEKMGKASQKAGQSAGSGMKKYGDSAEKASKQVKSVTAMTTELTQVGTRLLAIGAALSASAFFPVNAAKTFERSMSKVLAITDGAEESFDALKETASELGRTTIYTATQAAEGMVFLGMAGFEAGQVMEAIAPSLYLAVAGNMDLAKSADIASNVLQAFQLQVSDLTHVTDVLANTATSSNTSVIQLADALKYAAPIAASAGVSVETAAAAIGVLGNNGIQASLAGTAMRAMLVFLSAPTRKAQKALKELNVEIQYLDDGSLDLFGTLEALGDANMSLAHAATIFGRRAAAGALALSNQTEKFRALTKANYEADGAAKKMADTMQDNLWGAVIRVTSAFDGFMRALGDPLLAPLKRLMLTIAEFLTTLARAGQEVPRFMSFILSLVGTLGVLTTAVGVLTIAWASLRYVMKADFIVTILIPAVKSLIGWIGAAITAQITWASVTGALSAAFKVLAGAISTVWAALGPVGIVIAVISAAIIALVSYVALFRKTTDQLIEDQKRLRLSMGRVVQTFDTFIDRVKKAKEGSDEFSAASIALRAKIEQLGEENENLAQAASRAASSINPLTGELYDGGRAIEEFRQAALVEELKAFGDEAELLGKKIKNLTQAPTEFFEFLDQKIAEAIAGFKSLWAVIAFWSDEDPAKPALDLIDKRAKDAKDAEAELRKIAQDYVAKLVETGQIDLNLSYSELDVFLDKHSSATKEYKAMYRDAYTSIQFANDEKNKRVRQGDVKTLEKVEKELATTVDAQVKELQKLQQAYEEAAKKSEELADKARGIKKIEIETGFAVEDQPGFEDEYLVKGVDLQNQAARAVNERIQKAKELAEVEKETFTVTENLIKTRITLRDKAHNEELTNIKERHAVADVTEKQSQLLEFQQVEEYANAKLAIYDTQLEKWRGTELEKTESYRILEEQRSSIFEEATLARINRTEYETRLWNEKQKARLTAQREIEQDRINLMDDGYQKIQTRIDLEVRAFMDSDAAKALSAEDVERQITLIRAKGVKERLEYSRKASKEETEHIFKSRQLEIAQQQTVVDELERGLETRKVSTEKYFAEREELITQQYEAEVEKLKSLAAAAKEEDRPAIVLDIELRKEEFKQDLDELKQEKTEANDEMIEEEQRFQRAIKEAQKEAAGESNIVEQNEIELELLAAHHEQVIAEYTRLGFKKQEIAKLQTAFEAIEIRKRQQMEAAALQMRIQQMSTFANSLGTMFGEMYEASGQKIKAFFYLQKAAAIGETIMSTYSAAQKAYEMYAAWPPVAAAMAAIAVATGLARVAIIAQQNMARGGEVKGYSPTDTADNVPIQATAKEWVMPVKSVKKYGKKFMKAVQKQEIPLEFVSFMEQLNQGKLYVSPGVGEVPAARETKEVRIHVTRGYDSRQVKEHHESMLAKNLLMTIKEGIYKSEFTFTDKTKMESVLARDTFAKVTEKVLAPALNTFSEKVSTRLVQVLKSDTDTTREKETKSADRVEERKEVQVKEKEASTDSLVTTFITKILEDSRESRKLFHQISKSDSYRASDTVVRETADMLREAERLRQKESSQTIFQKFLEKTGIYNEEKTEKFKEISAIEKTLDRFVSNDTLKTDRLARILREVKQSDLREFDTESLIASVLESNKEVASAEKLVTALSSSVTTSETMEKAFAAVHANLLERYQDTIKAKTIRYMRSIRASEKESKQEKSKSLFSQGEVLTTLITESSEKIDSVSERIYKSVLPPDLAEELLKLYKKQRALNFASGGKVPGVSPHPKADNILAHLTAQEFVQPVESVKYYGTEIMEAMRRRVIPKEMFEYVNIPSMTVPVYGNAPVRMAEGGMVDAVRRNPEENAPPQVEVNVINNTGENVETTEQSTKFDGKKVVTDIVLEKYQTSRGFRQGFRR